MLLHEGPGALGALGGCPLHTGNRQLTEKRPSRYLAEGQTHRLGVRDPGEALAVWNGDLEFYRRGDMAASPGTRNLRPVCSSPCQSFFH